jgi:CRISPR/Cas system-associated endoribonuclease Cas2
MLLNFRGTVEGYTLMYEREAMRWLQLTYKVPSEPSQKRVWVWRRLQNLGAFALQNSVYLLPFSEEVEKQFRQLAQEIRDMGGEASIFSVVALDPADEQRILSVITEARNNEYLTVIKVCSRFLAKALTIIETQGWNEQVHAEFAEVLEKVHVLFRTAKRHDMLGVLTATKRADAAEALSTCEQVFRMLLDRDYARARRILEAHSEFLPEMPRPETTFPEAANNHSESANQDNVQQPPVDKSGADMPELPI